MTRCRSAPGVAIPLAEIELRASRSSGPGGQHANVTASRIEAGFDVEASQALDERQRADRCSRGSGPRVTAVAQDARGQARNRELALERLRRSSREGLRDAAASAAPTKPGPRRARAAAGGEAAPLGERKQRRRRARPDD